MHKFVNKVGPITHSKPLNYGTQEPHQYIIDVSRGRAVSVCRLYNTEFDWFTEIFHQVSDVARNLLVSIYITKH